MSDDKNVTFMNNNKSLVNIAYSSTCIILFTKSFLPATKSGFCKFPSNLIEGHFLCKGLRSKLGHIQTFGNDSSPIDLPLDITACQLV